jgi:CxxC-x17-CxxC domain-containing protein
LEPKSILFTHNHNHLSSVTGKNINNSMGNFQGGNRGGGGFRGGNGGGRSNYGGGNRGDDRGPVTMHKAVCDECHKSCEVPFRPSGDKPVYCNDCFSKKRGNDDRGPRKDFSGDRAPRREFNDRPTPLPFAKPAGIPNDTVKQFGEINARLDRIIAAIEKLPQPKETKQVEKIIPVLAKVDMPVHAGAKKVPAVKASAKKVVAKKKK